jgi:hypothetical protein|tara:strand:+ start:122 stop:313 length:192 start_codon:yes stop_codon:yes gene_type:complete
MYYKYGEGKTMSQKKKIIRYVQQRFEDAKNMNMFKFLRKEVEVNGTGTHKYRIKNGPNKDKVV